MLFTLFLTLMSLLMNSWPPDLGGPNASDDHPKPALNVLVCTATAGYRHDSIKDSVHALHGLAHAHNFAMTHIESEDERAASFTDGSLGKFDVIIFLNTTGDILNDAQQEAMQRFIQRGGGFVGVHAATDTEYGWPWYGQLVGATFLRHPQIQLAAIDVVDPSQPSTTHLPKRWQRTDEWYDFHKPPAEGVVILLKLDESTYEGGSMRGEHPVAWQHEFDGGRAWYTALGHTSESYAEPAFLRHLLGGIFWAADVPMLAVDEQP
ncbi:MAG: ThuA domain-containing protein [Phycisphaerales bacterium]